MNHKKQMNIQFPDEAEHLKDVNRKLQDALSKAEDTVARMEREYRDTKRYMVEYRGEIDPNEMFQNELLLKQADRTGLISVDLRDRLNKLKDSPYFARIDFRENGSEEELKYYIGRFTFSYERDPLIFDWRAPIASMFYDYETGPAGFEAPSGRREGELTRKRQFKIRNGELVYVLESSFNVQDEVLQQELSHTSDDKMKSIISTIQKEQNQIIRDEDKGTMIIQGVAGSGKTSIALHRIAYLLYRFKDRLQARNVTILSPNRVFGDYISSVIPELGEEPVFELGLDEVAEIQLERVIRFEPDRDPLETRDEAWAERVRFKSTPDFVELMDNYIKEVPYLVFKPADVVVGKFVAKGEWVGERYHAYHQYPVLKRLSMTAEDIRDRFQTDYIMEDERPRAGIIKKALTSMLVIKNTQALYKDFYRYIGKPELYVMPAKQTLEWADVYPFLYLHAAFEGIQESRITKHLVIDEMQDYTPIQYAALNRIFPCQKTILGDFGQSLNPNHLNGLVDLRKLYKEAKLVMLTKSYRSSYEIMTFAKQISGNTLLEPVKRHGEMVKVHECRDEQEEIKEIQSLIRAFKAGKHATLGIILKTGKEAEAMCGYLDGESEVYLITPESTGFQNGVTVTSIQMSKGLEFDEVIIPHADSPTYQNEYDRKLLYIACTRAMHKLTLTFTGEPSPLIAGAHDSFHFS